MKTAQPEKQASLTYNLTNVDTRAEGGWMDLLRPIVVKAKSYEVRI